MPGQLEREAVRAGRVGVFVIAEVSFALRANVLSFDATTWVMKNRSSARSLNPNTTAGPGVRVAAISALTAGCSSGIASRGSRDGSTEPVRENLGNTTSRQSEWTASSSTVRWAARFASSACFSQVTAANNARIPAFSHRRSDLALLHRGSQVGRAARVHDRRDGAVLASRAVVACMTVGGLVIDLWSGPGLACHLARRSIRGPRPCTDLCEAQTRLRTSAQPPSRGEPTT